MNKPIIEIKGLGKKYHITHQRGGYIALRDILAGILKNPFKFAKRKTKQIIGLETKEEFWALRDVSFEVNKGDVVGIIGRNGAGKSTLLKILTGITPPTEGEVIMRGHVASLLEVGTGFHPELTGRENIFLNGAIIGMTKKEIARKFDEIVAFAGVEKFLDTPVKYYSSGMYVRLAFSVAAHMEPDILFLDEVLAVGDAEFQKKCLGKMEEVAKTEGRTILFVSHNIEAIRRLCNKCVLIENGRIKSVGSTQKITDEYTNREANYIFDDKKIENEAMITNIVIRDEHAQTKGQISLDQPFSIEVAYVVTKPISQALFCVNFFTANNTNIVLSTETDHNPSLRDFQPGRYKTVIKIPAHLFNIGTYHLEISIMVPFVRYIDLKKGISVEIIDVQNSRAKIFNDSILGTFAPIFEYETTKMTNI